MVAALQAANVEADIYIADKGNNHVKNAADPNALQKSWDFLERQLCRKLSATDAQSDSGK